MKALILFCCTIVASCTTAYSATWYVNANAAGANTGTSWTDAFTTLNDGITASSTGDEIWVAQGVYKPTTTTTRGTSFNLPSGVAIYGGFNGTETLLSQRNVDIYTTTLSGDIGTTGNANDNTYHLVKANNVSVSTRLDGFTIMNGNTNYDSSLNGLNGGGLRNVSGSPTIAYCTFLSNQANGAGGAITHEASGNIKILHCNFIENSSGSDGGAIMIAAGTATIQDCNISLNESGSDGAAVYVYDGVANIDRCVISGNIGGGIYIYGATGNITNCLVVGNSAEFNAGVYFSAIGSFPSKLVNCTVADNNSSNQNNDGAVHLIGASSMSNCILWGNTTGGQLDNLLEGDVNNCIIQGGYTCTCATNILTGNPLFVSPGDALLAPFDASGYDYHVQSLSPAIDAGDNASLISIYNRDLDSLARTHGSTVDIGAYENAYCQITTTINASGPTSFCTGGSVTLTASGGSSFLWSNGSTTSSITVSTEDDYTVTAVDTSGCRGSDNQQVIVFQASVAISGAPNLCTGETQILTASGANIASYSWNLGGTSASISISTGGNYSVTATTGDGCTTSDDIIITEVAPPAPTISMNNGTLETGTFTTYQWNLNGGPISQATTGSYTPIQNGTYTVDVTNVSGCSATSPAYVLTNVGVDDIMNGPVTIYPNPVLTTLTIRDLPENTIVEIVDLRGKVLLSEKLNKNAVLDLSSLDQGIYMLRTEKGLKKIVKL